jgi:hypothetical protein
VLYIIEILDNTRSTVTVDPTYDMPNGAACMGLTDRAGNCPNRAEDAVQLLCSEYVAMETYCERHVGEGVVTFLQPEPDGCDGGCHPN